MDSSYRLDTNYNLKVDVFFFFANVELIYLTM